jgi:3-hydroxypropanoate dehydrogenase
MTKAIDNSALAQLFSEAHTHDSWQDKAIPETLIHQLYFVFITSDAGREKLKPAVSSGNLAKTMSAPCTVIVAYDAAFYEHLPMLFPYADAKSWFTSSPKAAYETAMRNSSLQGAYLTTAARALGLDAGPMSGFDATLLNQNFFADSTWKVNFLLNLGYGDNLKVHTRLPRLDFAQCCQIL